MFPIIFSPTLCAQSHRNLLKLIFPFGWFQKMTENQQFDYIPFNLKERWDLFLRGRRGGVGVEALQPSLPITVNRVREFTLLGRSRVLSLPYCITMLWTLAQINLCFLPIWTEYLVPKYFSWVIPREPHADPTPLLKSGHIEFFVPKDAQCPETYTKNKFQPLNAFLADWV